MGIHMNNIEQDYNKNIPMPRLELSESKLKFKNQHNSLFLSCTNANQTDQI